MPVVAPDIEEVQFARGQPLHFVATLETAPDFTLPEYKGLRAQREVGGATAGGHRAGVEPVSRAPKDLSHRGSRRQERRCRGGQLHGDLRGQTDHRMAPTAKGLTENKAFWIETEKDSFLPGFSGQLLGAKAGEKRTVTVDFAGDFMLAGAGRQEGRL